mmetsp:Transcript_12598/g.15869  ORF Transcript_12598/g.15869 Transcript_12598/m.15869 type:complete len:91 (-) Transcript_12598:281-553(-)|eukprot:CAMPEP_0172502458 /NCGR_PEP_ID=MMETSP1066-20121228/160217_1 /TAXON_ID=671091 /ORGANISM="Coscinodiscus wailesii, Strain CCMP2513" /LENGTH=90 /DNA_ID=CAMNT_0013277717 /DNA_START=145 /DNA_END=417 /DNA_ORIENTATION=-
MALISTASRGLLRTNAVVSRALLNNSNVGASSAGARRFMGGDGHEGEHLTFHPPYDKKVIAGLVLFVVVGGSGSMAYGLVHQQYKQGFWK